MTTHMSPESRPARAPRRALWLGVYLAILTLLSGVFIGRRVSAELSERGMALGRAIDDFAELRGRVTQLSWNGLDFAVSTLVIDQPVAEVLERFVALCDQGNGSVARELAAGLGGGARATSVMKRMLVLRDLFEDGTGSSVCLAGLGEGGLAGLSERARRFGGSLDLSDLGHPRFAFVRKVDEGRTHVLLVTGDGSLRLDQLIPLAGRDAEGTDVVEGVRPAASTRVLSASAKGTPHGLSAYRSRLSAPAVLADYGKKLTARGFERVLLPAHAAEIAQAGVEDPLRTEVYRRGPSAFVVTSRSEGEGSLLSVVQLSAAEIPRPGSGAEIGRGLVGRGRLGAPRDPAFE